MIKETSAQRLRDAIAIVFAVGVVLIVVGCEKSEVIAEPILRPVRHERVALVGMEETRTFSGITKAEVESTLSFKVAGTVTERPVDVGTAVSTNQLVARLDPQDYRVSLQQAEAGLAQARAELRNAEASYERTRGLYENRNASRSDLDSARAAAESAAAGVTASERQREAARLQLSYTELRAPQECSVAETFVIANENVSAGQGVVRVNCGDCAEVTVSVSESYIARIRSGDEAEVVIGAIKQDPLPAVVTEVGIASGGSAFAVTVALQGDCPEVRSGMAADVRFHFAATQEEPQIAVPPIAVGEDRDGRYVFVLEPGDREIWRARRQAVTVAGIGQNGIVIAAGLSGGELIVTAGVRRITDGQEVRLLDRIE